MKKFVLFSLLLCGNLTLAAGWIKRADFGSMGRHRGTAMSIGNRGYMGLGHYNGAGPNIVKKDWWEYDPGTNAWTQKADYIGNPTGAYAVLAFGMEEFGFIGGGQTASSTAFYKYDPATNTWTAVANSPTIPVNIEGFVIGNKGYYLAGNQVYQYDAVTNQWTTKNPAPFSIGVWNSTFVIDGKGYIKNGSSLWEYKPTTDQWISRSAFPGLATGGSSGFAHRGKGYIVSGYAGWLSEVNNEVWEFDPAANTWIQLADFAGTARRFSSAFSIGDRSYFGIGTNGTNFNDFWEYNAYLGLEEESTVSVNCYPNPSSEKITIEINTNETFQLVVYDLTGRELYRKEGENGKVSLTKQDVPGSGTYLYTLENANSIIYSNKLIFN